MDRTFVVSTNSGKELNVLVAEKIMDYRTINAEYGVFDTGNGFPEEWNPSTDLNDAWNVIEKVQSEWSWDFQMINLAKEIDVRIGNGYCTSTSLPEAICRATLLNYLHYQD